MATASSTFTGTESPLSEGGVWAVPSAYWQTTSKANGLKAVTLSADSAARYVGTTFTADHWSELTVAAVPTGGQLFFQYAMARMNATAACYQLSTAFDVGANVIQLWKIDNAGNYTQIGADITLGASIAANDVMRIECVGTTINAKYNGSLVRTATDSTLATGGPAVGGWSQNNVVLVSAWNASDITSGAAPPFRSRNPSWQYSV